MNNKSLKLLKDTYHCSELESLDNVFPVPIGQICSTLGIKPSFAVMQRNESGKIFLSDNQYFIHVNKTDHPLRQRFTVAHELGHYCLHKDILDQDKQILERNDCSSLGVDYKEVQANNFAADLLMPEAHFLQKYSELQNIHFLSDYFLVSEMAVNTRLINLGQIIG